jgi:hypothetical protein
MQVFQFPYLSRDVWHSLYRSIYQRLVDFDRDKPTRFFELYPELNPGHHTAIEDQVKHLVGLIAHYLYDSMNLVARFDTAYKMLQVRGIPMAKRIASALKFSGLMTTASVLNGVPLNKAMTDFMIKSLPFLVKDNGKYGATLILPYLLPLGTTYFEAPVPKGFAGMIDEEAGLNMVSLERIMTAPELSSFNIGYGAVDAASDAFVPYSDEWPADFSSTDGYLVNRIHKDYEQTVAHFVNKWQGSIMRPGNPLRDFLIDLGFLDTTFSVQDISTVSRSTPIYDADDYAAKVFNYGSTLSPVFKTFNSSGTPSETDEPDADALMGSSNNLPMAIPDWDELNNTDWEKDTTQYVIETEAASRIELPYAYLSALTDVGLQGMRENQDFNDPTAVNVKLMGFNEDYGARDWTVNKADFGIQDGYYSRLSGYYHAVKNLSSFSNAGLMFTDGDEPLVAVNDQNVLLNRIEYEQDGIFRPYWEVSPMKNPMDPFQNGFFLVCSMEDAGVAGEFESQAGTVWAKWLSSSWNVPSGLTISGGDPDNNVWNEYGETDLKDVLIFLGDDIDSTPLLHFMREDIGRSCWFSVDADLDVTYGTNGEQTDHGPMGIPAKPITGIKDSTAFGGLVSSVGSPITGIGYDSDSNSPIMGYTRRIVDGSITLTSPIFSFILNLIFGGSQPTTLGGLLAAIFSPDSDWSLNYVVNNDFLNAADLRLSLAHSWLPLFHPSSIRLTPVTLREGIFAMWSHVRPSAPQEPSAIPAIVSKALPSASISAGDISDAIPMLLDLQFIQRRERDKKPSDRKSRSKSKPRRYSKSRGKDKRDSKKFDSKYTKAVTKPDSLDEMKAEDVAKAFSSDKDDKKEKE